MANLFLEEVEPLEAPSTPSESSRTCFTPTELFLGRPGFNFESPCAGEGNPKVYKLLTEQKGLPIYADHSWKRKEVRKIVPRTAKEKKLSIKLVTGFWYITQHSRPGRVTR